MSLDEVFGFPRPARLPSVQVTSREWNSRARAPPSFAMDRRVDVDVNHLNLDDIKELVCQLVQRNNQLKKQQQQGRSNSRTEVHRQSEADSPVSYYERSRLLPSYLTARHPLKKRTKLLIIKSRSKRHK
ncbi:UNVERIFIED_CONTAM: hypothetical protein NCL1_29199 [Trichonephila clavipes]